MTKLYHAAGTWQIPGQQDKKAERVDVPSSPAELAAWLNDRRVMPDGGELEALRGEIIEQHEIDRAAEQRTHEDPLGLDLERRNRCPECKALLIATEAGADTAAIGRTIDRITSWMAAAPDWALNRISENLSEFAAELRNKGRAN